MTIKHFPRNTAGRDFVVGDIHGMFSLLETRLTEIGFDKTRDRLFSVGDLIDRGPESHWVLDYLNQPWFHPVLGNHDWMALDYLRGKSDGVHWKRYCGGIWIQGVDATERGLIAEALEDLPYAIEVETEHGLIGIVHADVPYQTDWSEFTTQLQRNEMVRSFALWCCDRAENRIFDPVPGVSLVYCGHTTLDSPMKFSNVHFIDTGAYHIHVGDKPGTLTILELGT